MKKRPTPPALWLIIALFIALAVVYSVVVPPFEASDELWHYPMVKYIADNWRLPVQEPDNVGPWRQEGSQPPLYYAVAAAATAWIDTADMEQVRHLNPHVDNGIATADGNINLVVHNPALESFPWRGTVLAVHLIRFLSILMGAAAVYLTYRIALEILPHDPGLALSAAAVHGFTPMFVFISAAVNNDNLVIPLCSLALLMLLRLAKEQGEVRTGRYLLLGVVLGLAALTKTSSLALTVLTALVVTVRAVRRRSWREFVSGGLLTLLPLLLISGWWFLRNLHLYGDLTGFSAFFQVLGTRDVPANLAQLWRERFSFMAGYWGNFGGLNVPLPSWLYSLLNWVAVAAALGLLIRILKPANLKPANLKPANLKPANLKLETRQPATLLLLWGLGVLLPWLWWARVTWSSQGRLIFPAISVWSFLLVLGLDGWLPRRPLFRLALPLLLLAIAAAAPFAWIGPAYALPQPLSDTQVAAIPHRLDAEFDPVLRLLGYDLETSNVEPGGRVTVTLYWEALQPTTSDQTVFVHLLGEGELLVAQRDTFPGLGLLSTTWLEPGFRWADRYVLLVPSTAYAPDAAQIEVGLYDDASGTRLPARAADGGSLGDNVRFGQVAIASLAGDVPNPIRVNFGEEMTLVGYDLSARVVQPGETVTVTLYWRGQRQMETNYTISTQLVDSEQRKAAQQDSWPLDGNAPTGAWEPGQLIADQRALAVFADAAPGVYDVRVAVYVLEEGEIVHLPVVPESGEMLADHVVLTRVRVGQP